MKIICRFLISKMKCIGCTFDLAPKDNFCGNCRLKVEIDHHGDHLKKCPSCESLQKLSQKYCSGCAYEMPVDKKIGNSVENSTVNDELNGNENQPPTFMYPGSPKRKKIEHRDLKFEEAVPVRGLVVICTHTTFKGHPTHGLNERQGGSYDETMMENTWKMYDDCDVLTFKDKTNFFYTEELQVKIQEKLKFKQNVKYFVFVLSTHGDERQVAGMHYEHYFYTKDGQLRTQDLMEKINAISGLNGRMKLFFIQACRSRATNTEDDNKDLGVSIPITSAKSKRTIRQRSKSTDYQDAKGYMPSEKDDNKAKGNIPTFETDDFSTQKTKGNIPTSEKDDYFSSKTKGNVPTFETEKTEGYDCPDAIACMHSPMEEDDENKDAEPETEIPHCVEDAEPMIPHSEDCVVVFGSMAGKETYSTIYSADRGGGWMIRALHSTLISYKGDNVHIFDILTEVNRTVGMRNFSESKCFKAQSCFFHNLALDDEDMTLYKTKKKEEVE
ncbi:uncharacterized protein LOC127703787 isoform X1 [Mytilus californianus]|uniref:uncharacterized protein LOC127703787 isoform X1 n=2 Tax=Mytilus californianus TaxID=6549 RepID=UPI0022452F0B|nr:uncharacterized protein LOC127703787 isoform X1 [Mytilus californianus]